MGAQRFTETGDPRYVHKIAVFMDRMADIYYGLPLSDCNELGASQGRAADHPQVPGIAAAAGAGR